VNPLRRNAAMYGSFSHPSEQAPHGTPPTLHCGFCGPTGVTAVGVVGSASDVRTVALPLTTGSNRPWRSRRRSRRSAPTRRGSSSVQPRAVDGGGDPDLLLGFRERLLSWLWMPTARPASTRSQAPEAVSAVQPIPGPVRSQSAVELAPTFRHHQSQWSELQVRSTTITAWRTKRSDRFVSIEKVNTF
jgi:hypothetical protein